MGHLVKVLTYQGDDLQGKTDGAVKYELHWQRQLKPAFVAKVSNRSVTFTLTSFFSNAFPSGNFSPKHMLIVYSGEPPLFSLNCFSSGQKQKNPTGFNHFTE